MFNMNHCTYIESIKIFFLQEINGNRKSRPVTNEVATNLKRLILKMLPFLFISEISLIIDFYNCYIFQAQNMEKLAQSWGSSLEGSPNPTNVSEI